jgi:zinc protease
MSIAIRTATILLACATLASAQAVPDRSRAPVPGAPPAVTLPAIAKRTLSNGVPVWIVEQHEVPVAHLSLVVRAGATSDPAGKAGLASLVTSLMTEGAGSRDALALADAIDVLGASITAGAGWDASAVSLHVPVARLGDALPLMADVALRPTFAAADVERVRTELLTSFIAQRDAPAAVSARAFAHVVFGPTHPYGTGVAGTTPSVKAIAIQDLKDAHARLFHPAHALLVVVGDVTADGVMPTLEQAFGGWKGQGTAPAPVTVATAPPTAKREIILVDKPGSAQSQIRIGAVGVSRSTPDYAALTVMNTILGGSFTSRLNTNLRETHGYAYGAGSRFDMRRSQGLFFATASVQTDKTRESVQEFFNEFTRMLAPTPAGDLAKAKNYVALGYPADFETTRDIAGKLQELFVHGLPEDEPAQFVPKVNALTVADLDAAAKKYITPTRFVIVVVGDRAAVEPGLKALNLGPVRVVPLDVVMGEK